MLFDLVTSHFAAAASIHLHASVFGIAGNNTSSLHTLRDLNPSTGFISWFTSLREEMLHKTNLTMYSSQHIEYKRRRRMLLTPKII
jgi:hypothetical protein